MLNKKLLVKSVVFGGLCGMLVSLIFMGLTAFVMLSSGLLPLEISKYVTVGILSVGCMFGSFIAVKINKSAALIVGILTGLFMFMAVTVIGLCLSQEAMTAITAAKLVCSLIFGCIGGFLGLMKKERIKIK